MPLATGDKLVPYEIVALIGAVGMGEVYRATTRACGAMWRLRSQRNASASGSIGKLGQLRL
jgi:hypothetical protein